MEFIQRPQYSTCGSTEIKMHVKLQDLLKLFVPLVMLELSTLTIQSSSVCSMLFKRGNSLQREVGMGSEVSDLLFLTFHKTMAYK